MSDLAPVPSPPEGPSVAARILRLLTLAGLVCLLLWQMTGLLDPAPRQHYSLLALPLFGAMALLVLVLVVPRETGRLVACPDLLVPLGLYALVQGLLQLLLQVKGIGTALMSSAQIPVGIFTFAVSPALIVQGLLGVVAAGWTTKLLLQETDTGHVDLLQPWREPGTWLWQTLVVLVIGVVTLFVGLMLAITLMALTVVVALVAMGLFSLAWNLYSAALLPVTLRPHPTFWEALTDGFRVSKAGMNRWRWPVFAQMLALGWVTIVYVSYTESTPAGTTHQTSWNYSVNAFWTGSYEADCRWHAKLMEVVKAPPLPLVSTLLYLLFGALAVAVKLRITRQSREVPSRDVLAAPLPTPPP